MCHKTQLPSSVAERQLITGSIVGLGLDRRRHHSLEQDFKGHRMCTTVVRYKKFTIATINTVVETYVVIIVVAMKGQVKFVEEKTISLLCVTPRLLTLANQSVIHLFISFRD